MTKRSILSFGIVILLLIAQHGAITHSVWHLGKHLPAEHQSDNKSKSPQDKHSHQSKLCDLHFAMGSVLATGCGSQPAVAAPDLTRWLATSTVAWRVAQPALTPPSRAPPVLL